MANFSILSQSSLFRSISEEKLKELFFDIHYQVKKYSTDETVVMAGETCDRLSIVQVGSVKAEMNDYSGKTIKIEDIEAPYPFATAFLFGKNNQFPVTVVANTYTEIVNIPKAEFVKLLQKDMQLLNNYLNAISTRTQFLSRKLKFLSFRTIKQKIAHYLLEQAGNRLQTVEIPHSQGQLAEIFGVTRPALARTLGEMSKEGYIEIQRRYIKIIDKEKMNLLLKS